MIVSYFTPKYEIEADRLSMSAERLGLDIHIESIESQGTWMDAVRMKPVVLKKLQDRFADEHLLFVDADAIFHADPWPALQPYLDFDVACHFWGCDVMSGTLFIRQGVQLFDKWIEQDKLCPHPTTPQRVLARILRSGSFTVGQLPPELCWIFDLSRQTYGDKEPIIEHLQASRQYRNPEKQNGLLAARTLRIKEIENSSLSY